METNSDPSFSNHVIVCGFGHIGYRCVSLLMRLGERGTVISRNPNEDWRQIVEPQFHVFTADARDDTYLLKAGVKKARAIIVVTDDDLSNVAIALDAKRLNPGITIVVRMFDQALAAHLEKTALIDRALSGSALGVPIFISAALGIPEQRAFKTGETSFFLEEYRMEADSPHIGKTPGQWSAATGKTLVALKRGKTFIPGHKMKEGLQSGDHLALLRIEKSPGKSASARAFTRKQKTHFPLLRTLKLAIQETWQNIAQAPRVALILLFAIVAISIGVFHHAHDLSLVDSFYFVITTITTVGYGDFNLMNAEPWLKLYGAFVMLCGAAILATLFSIITDLLLKTRLRDVIAHSCADLEGHIIIAGLGNIGFRLVREMVNLGETVVAIECREDGEYVRAARELVPVQIGNAKFEETLRKAGIAGAKAIVAATDDDLANLSIGLVAKSVHPDCRVVLRIFDSTLATKMQEGLGVDSVLSVSAIAAASFVGAAISPYLCQGLLLKDYLIFISDRIVPPASGSDSHETIPLAENEFILYVKRTGTPSYIEATPDMALSAGDQIILAQCHPIQKPTPQS